MKISHLPLMAQWYEMIERGEKLEEYRENKPYWQKRLLSGKWDAVKFRYGYTTRTMTFRIKEIRLGKGKKEWGAIDDEVFIIELGERIKEKEEE